ncbi:MAG: MlaD family protein [Candidatus Dependentiae bacterium]
MRYTRETKVGIFVLAAIAVFGYMSFYLGMFRFDHDQYVRHTLYFQDISGLLKKAEVKIAGVNIGWIHDISLVDKDGMCARADVMIDKAYHLYQDAYGVVRQEGIIGPVYLEIVPGDPSLPQLMPGSSLVRPQTEPASVDELMRSFKDIATEIHEIAKSVKDALGTDQQVNEITHVVSGVNHVVDQLNTQVLPAFTESVQNIAQVIDRDFGRFAQRAEETADCLDAASDHMVQGFEEVNAIARDINAGNGFMGKMMQDEQIYNNVRFCTDQVAHAFDKFSDLYFTYDGHVENMFEQASFSCFKNAKGIFNVRIYPRPDYFYLVGVTTSQQGYIRRTTTLRDFTDDCFNEVCSDEQLPEWAKYQYIFNENRQRIKRNAFKVDLQFGKVFNYVALRAGLIEGTGGFAADLFVPYSDRIGLISTFKMYDFRGQNRIDDERPHLKWINRIFLFDTVYIAFGFDDFVSKCDKSVFLGAGFRFGDEDIKYLLPNFVGT